MTPMPTILVVDDNPSIVGIFVRMLEQSGYRTLSAGSGEEALNLLESNRPDLVLLDILMEPMDGWETLERIKASSAGTPSIPVFMLTSKDLTPGEAERYGHSFEDYIKKPITRGELTGAIVRFFHDRDRMEIDLQLAGEGGAGPEIIEEYRSLRSDIEGKQHLVRILGNMVQITRPSPQQEKEYTRVIQSINSIIAEKMDRLDEITRSYPALGSRTENGQ